MDIVDIRYKQSTKMTTMNIRRKQQPQIMIMMEINQTLIMNIMTTMNIMSKQQPQVMII